MIKKLVEQGLVKIEQSDQDKRKEVCSLDGIRLGAKKKLEIASVRNWESILPRLSDNEIQEFEEYQERIISNLKAKEKEL